MKKYLSHLLLSLLLAFGLSACASTTQGGSAWDNFLALFGEDGEINPDAIEMLENISGTKLLLVNVPTIKFYDLAVVRITQFAINIDLFQAGTPIGVLEIQKDNICFQGECAAKSLVVRKMFGTVSYPELLDDIILGRDIFQSRGLRIARDGALVQRFLLNNQEISYERTVQYIVFKNLTTGATISIQDYVLPTAEPPKASRRR